HAALADDFLNLVLAQASQRARLVRRGQETERRAHFSSGRYSLQHLSRSELLDRRDIKKPPLPLVGSEQRLDATPKVRVFPTYLVQVLLTLSRVFLIQRGQEDSSFVHRKTPFPNRLCSGLLRTMRISS